MKTNVFPEFHEHIKVGFTDRANLPLLLQESKEEQLVSTVGVIVKSGLAAEFFINVEHK